MIGVYKRHALGQSRVTFCRSVIHTNTAPYFSWRFGPDSPQSSLSNKAFAKMGESRNPPSHEPSRLASSSSMTTGFESDLGQSLSAKTSFKSYSMGHATFRELVLPKQNDILMKNVVTCLESL